MAVEPVSSFIKWKIQFLNMRDMTVPDGRQLYAYRTPDKVYDSLEAFLKEKLSIYQKRTDLGMVAGNVLGFPALFVLYAAEWWRRRYDGSGFSYEPMLRDLGVDPEGWSQAQRSKCVQRGLKDWGLSLRESGGLRYLGSIALQGGLPMRLLATARGNLGRVLHSVLQQAKTGTATLQDIQNWVESLRNYLPQTYRQNEIYALLAEVVWTVLHLREEANLTSGEDSISKLDKSVPGWRDRFPLLVDEEATKGLIDQLIREAVQVRVVRQKLVFPLERMLDNDPERGWFLRSAIDVPETITTEELKHLFHLGEAELARSMEINLSMDGVRQAVSVRRLAGHERYRIDRRPLGATEESVTAEHVLQLNAPDGRSWSVVPPRGAALDSDFPWIFQTEDDGHHFIRQGGGSVAATQVLVAVPADWSGTAEDGSECVSVGNLFSPNRVLYRVCGTARFSGSSSPVYKVRTGQANARDEFFQWHGQRVWQEFVRPDQAFRGFPKLYVVDDKGQEKLVPGEPGWRPLGSSIIHRPQPTGPLEVWYPATGEVQHRSFMVILPESSSQRLEFLDSGSGRIHLINWGVVAVQVLTPGIVSDVDKHGTSVVITLGSAERAHPPEWVEMDLTWALSVKPARVRMPFPARGGRAFDARGLELPDQTLVPVQRLTGLRLLALGGDSGARMTLELSHSESGSGIYARHTIRAPEGSVHVELKLQDFATDIQRMLAAHADTDARVRVSLKINGQSAVVLLVARYACRLERNDRTVRLDAHGLSLVDVSELATLPVLALRLDVPGDEPVAIASVESEGVATGVWDFDPDNRDTGSWLIYPAPDSILPFRPMLWQVAGESTEESALAKALGKSGLEERNSAIDQVIESMALDYLEPCWTDVEQLAGQLGHLPLPVLDIWRRFACSPTAMAALAMRFLALPGGFLERFALELPFSWETVSFNTWRSSMERLMRQCDGWFGVTSESIWRPHLESRISELGALYPALNYMLGFSRAAAAHEVCPEVRACRHPGMLPILNGRLFAGEDCSMQRLLRTHAEPGNATDQWPTHLCGRIAKARHHPEQNALMCPQDLGFREGVINLPILLAYQASTDATSEWFEHPGLSHDITMHQVFDPDWFTDAYDMTVARCLAVGLLEFPEATTGTE